MSFYVTVFAGSAPLGGLFAGAVAEAWGTPAAFLAGAALSFAHASASSPSDCAAASAPRVSWGSRAWTARDTVPCARRTGGSRRLSGALSGCGSRTWSSSSAAATAARRSAGSGSSSSSGGREQVPAHGARSTASDRR